MQTHKKCARQNEIELGKAQHGLFLSLFLSHSGTHLFVCGLGRCWLGEGCCHSVGLGDLCVSIKHIRAPGVLSAFGEECEARHGLMRARALAGPTVEQQGEMARSGGRTLATLDPEQVRTFPGQGIWLSGQV